jgi:PAS domain S-box-containing protein
LEKKASEGQCGPDEERALRIIMEGTAGETGEGFFKSLVKNLAMALDTSGAWVTEYLYESKKLSSLAFWLSGEWVLEYVYDISGTPCELVVEKKDIFLVPENVIELFPRDPDLKPMGGVSYMGVPLLDTDGSVLGHLAVLDSKPMTDESRVRTIFRIFAARASAELRRMRAEREVREREEKLGRLFDSALDAIVELNNMLEINMMNPAAEKLFKSRTAETRGRSFLDILGDGSGEKLKGLISELALLPEGGRYIWVAGGLTGRQVGGGLFKAEATLSQFEMGRKRFYTVILRDINERLEAEKKIKMLSEEADYLKEEIDSLRNFGEIIGESAALLKVLANVKQVAKTDATVLIYGETGTGKELVARAIHAESDRRDKPLIRVNCAAIPAALIESEFFGHEKGAFTGATAKREGRFALASGGTIFLDEIGELPLDLQSKLLRVLQGGEYESVGSSETRKTDVRVIAATNRDLHQDVKEGKFREDLYYRLSVFPLILPPLRERGDDVIKLARIFAEKFAKRMGVTLDPFTQAEIDGMMSYRWPGNVRELQNVIERAVITSHQGQLNLERAIPQAWDRAAKEQHATDHPREKRVLTRKEMEELEKRNIIAALEKTGWRVSGESGAARLLGLPHTTLASRIKALGIKRQN